MSELDMPIQVKAAATLTNEAFGVLPEDQAKAFDKPRWRKLSEKQPQFHPVDSNVVLQDSQKAAQFVEKMNLVLDSLTDRERKAATYQAGLVDGKSHTFEETAQWYGISPDRTRYILSSALRKIRHESRARRLIPFLTPIYLRRIK